MFSWLKREDRKKEDPPKKPTIEFKRNKHGPYQYLLKLIVVGDYRVGKTSIVLRFVEPNNWNEKPMITISPDFVIQRAQINGRIMKLAIWDTPGVQGLQSCVPTLFGNCNGVMSVFDITNKRSFETSKCLLGEVERYASSDVFKVLVGNKCCQKDRREVDYSLAKDFADSHQIPYMEVSAKYNINIVEAFEDMVRSIVAKMEGCSVEEHLMPKDTVVTVGEGQLSQHEATPPHGKQLNTDQNSDKSAERPRSSRSNVQEASATAIMAVCQEELTEKGELEEYKRKAIKADKKVWQLMSEVEEYQEVIEEKNEEIHQSNATNQILKQTAEEANQAVLQQLQERDEQLARNQEIIQDLQTRLKQSDEAVQVATQQVREREQEALRYTDNVRALERQIQELTEEAAESQQHVTELEQQLRQAEGRLTNSDQVFQDIFQRLLGQLPQSQPHWVVQRREIQLTNEQLGTGGWASVKVAIFRGQRVAAKCLHDQIISAHNIRLFTREMSMAAQARHPNLLQFVGATMDNNPIILTELMPTSLRRILEQSVHLNRRQIISIASDVARALNYLHLNTPDPIVHRDISSANVLLEQFGDVYKAKVSDYGSANFSRYTTTAGPGNPLYSAPESDNPSQQSVKMDVYSFGLLLIEMCSGELFNDHEELIRSRIGDWPEIVTIIRPCIRRDPKRRPNIDAVLTQLTQIQLC